MDFTGTLGWTELESSGTHMELMWNPLEFWDTPPECGAGALSQAGWRLEPGEHTGVVSWATFLNYAAGALCSDLIWVSNSVTCTASVSLLE